MLCTRVGVSDALTAENEFHGALFALAGEYRLNSWYVQGRGGVSFGGTFRRAAVSGSTSIQAPPAAPVAAPGGLLALASNSGTFSGSDWVFVPEASVRVGYRVTENLRVYAGYSGWGPGQLEGELKANAWFIAPADSMLVFDEDREKVWEQAMERRTRQPLPRG